MKVGIGLPVGVRDLDGRRLVDWARRAEDAGFSSLGVIDRLVAWNYEPFVALSAAAAVTERIDLVTSVLLSPLRTNTALLAKQALSLDRLSGGRLVLGLGLGGRPDDYSGSGLETAGRGAFFERQLDELKRIWNGESRGFAGPIGPAPLREGGPRLIVGGYVEASFRRAATYGDGWSMGGGAPGQFTQMHAAFEAAWKAAGRSEAPRTYANAAFALGPRAREGAERFMRDYFAFMGERLEMLIASVPDTPEKVQGGLAAFEQAGCDELILLPTSDDLEQVDLLADAARRWL